MEVRAGYSEVRACLDQLEKLQAIRSDDMPAVEKFADLKTIKVIKLQQLQAEGHAKKLGDGILHSLLVTWLSARKLQLLVDHETHWNNSYSFPT